MKRRGFIMDKLWGLVSLAVLAPFFLFLPGMVDAEEKLKIGLVEDVILLPWGVKLPARIDTGAASSSLDARELKVEDDVADFKLPDPYGGLRLRLPVVGWKTIRTSESRERRPVIEMEICLGPKPFRIKANLNDRSMVKYPLIIGRSALRKNFVVDCMKSNCLPPTCKEVPSP
jgi:hypothetical protein